MQQNITDPLLIVLLDDMVQHTLPRVFSIRNHLEQGQILINPEIYFFSDLLDQINEGLRNYHNDVKSRIIFCTIAHLVFKVIKLALKNEQANYKFSALAIKSNEIEQRVMARKQA